MNDTPIPARSASFARSPAAAEFIERMGVILAEDGLPRIAGRIFALMLVTAEPLSLDQMVTRLEVSKGSVSQETRRLEQRGLLERIGLPGDRRVYFRLRDDLALTLLESRVRRWRRILEATTAAGQRLGDAPTVVTERLQDLTAGLSESIDRLAGAVSRRRDSRRWGGSIEKGAE
ncbi:MAG TPA: MarR family transcriptional regulator [Gemmatimonadales bacterium]|nr:MarR family transcriptional regulator [Gemmatimonadales bacterium]